MLRTVSRLTHFGLVLGLAFTLHSTSPATISVVPGGSLTMLASIDGVETVDIRGVARAAVSNNGSIATVEALGFSFRGDFSPSGAPDEQILG